VVKILKTVIMETRIKIRNAKLVQLFIILIFLLAGLFNKKLFINGNSILIIVLSIIGFNAYLSIIKLKDKENVTVRRWKTLGYIAAILLLLILFFIKNKNIFHLN